MSSALQDRHECLGTRACEILAANYLRPTLREGSSRIGESIEEIYAVPGLRPRIPMKSSFIPVLLMASLLPAAAQTTGQAPAAPATQTATATPPAPAGNDTVVEEIVARVNNSIITR